MQPLEATIAKEFAAPADRADLGTIVGARSDDELVAWIDRLCRERLGSEVAGARFADKSVGAVFGLVLVARGRAFTAVERSVVNAAADYLLAQVARQEVEEYQRLLRATEHAPLISW